MVFSANWRVATAWEIARLAEKLSASRAPRDARIVPPRRRLRVGSNPRLLPVGVGVGCAPVPPLWVWERAALPDDWLQEKLIKPMKIQ